MNTDFSNGVSVIICCYNSASRLQQTLAHLAAQEVDKNIPWELIIVDNNCTDDTVQFAKDEWTNLSVKTPLKIVEETKSGLSFAREIGAATASYDLILFCDDDNWLNENYIQLAHEHMREHPRTGVLGGEGIAFIDGPKPAWFDSYENVFAVGRQLKKSGLANKRKYLFGAGMVIRKSIYEKIEELKHVLFLTCRKGNELSSGGDSEICLLALQMGYDLYYEERLQFTHFIPSARLNWAYCVEMISKGFAHPQIYYAMYEYGFNAVAKNEHADFDQLYKWQRRKQQRILWHECNSFKKSFSAMQSLLISRPGNDKEIRIKTAKNKLRYLKNNKEQLAQDFKKILALSAQIISLQEGSVSIRQAENINSVFKIDPMKPESSANDNPKEICQP